MVHVTFIEDEIPFDKTLPISNSRDNTINPTVKFLFFDDSDDEDEWTDEVGVTPLTKSVPPSISVTPLSADDVYEEVTPLRADLGNSHDSVHLDTGQTPTTSNIVSN